MLPPVPIDGDRQTDGRTPERYRRLPHAMRLASINIDMQKLQKLTKGKGSPYSTNERRVPELIPVLGSQPAGDVSHKPGCHYFPPGLQLAPQPSRGLLPMLLLGEQRHNGCEQFA